MARVRSWLPTLVAYAIIAVAVAAGNTWFLPVRVAGGSMRPALAHGDIVIVSPSARPTRGEIALLASGPGQALHRVRSVGTDGSVTTRGDANPVDDFSTTPRERIRGTVVAVLPVGAALERWR